MRTYGEGGFHRKSRVDDGVQANKEAEVPSLRVEQVTCKRKAKCDRAVDATARTEVKGSRESGDITALRAVEGRIEK